MTVGHCREILTRYAERKAAGYRWQCTYVLQCYTPKYFKDFYFKADWDTVKFLQQHVDHTHVEEADWIDAVVVAMDLLKTETEGRKGVSALKIVLFSELGLAANPDQLDIIVQGMKMIANIEFTHIGPDWVDIGDPINGNGEAANGDNGMAEPRAGPSRGEPQKHPAWKYPRKPRSKVQTANEELIKV